MTNFYGQMIIGAPGSGKSTYCAGLEQIFQGIKRPFALINLDPANEGLPFKAHVDINELIRVEDVMERLELGPNGALLYCMQTLAANLDWLRERLEQFRGFYLIFDMPGQLELYCSDDSIRRIISQFSKWNWNICAICLTDSTYVKDPGKFISVILSALTAMINLEVAQINVLSKADLFPVDAPFRLDYFEQLPNLKYLADLLDDHPALKKYKKLNHGLCELVEDYGLVGFVPLDVSNKELMANLLRMADNANGFCLAGNSEDSRRNVLMKEGGK